MKSYKLGRNIQTEAATATARKKKVQQEPGGINTVELEGTE